jgi:hypothetical protein
VSITGAARPPGLMPQGRREPDREAAASCAADVLAAADRGRHALTERHLDP